MAGTSTTPNKDAQDQELLQSIAPYLSSLLAQNGSAGSDTAASTSTSSITKLTYASAKALMQIAADDANYVGKFTKADVDAFIKAFNQKQKEQIERVVVKTREKVTPGATADATK